MKSKVLYFEENSSATIFQLPTPSSTMSSDYSETHEHTPVPSRSVTESHPFPPRELTSLTSVIRRSYQLRERVYHSIDMDYYATKVDDFRKVYGLDSYLARYFGPDWNRTSVPIKQNDIVLCLMSLSSLNLFEFANIPVIVFTPDSTIPPWDLMSLDYEVPVNHQLFHSSQNAAKRLRLMIDDCYTCVARVKHIDPNEIVLYCFIVSLYIRPASEQYPLPTQFDSFKVIYRETFFKPAAGPRSSIPLPETYWRLMGVPIVPLAPGVNIGKDKGGSHGIVVSNSIGEKFLFTCGHILSDPTSYTYYSSLEDDELPQTTEKYLEIQQPCRSSFARIIEGLQGDTYKAEENIRTVASGTIKSTSRATIEQVVDLKINCMIGDLVNKENVTQVDFSFLPLTQDHYCNIHIGPEELWYRVVAHPALKLHNVTPHIEFSGKVISLSELSNLQLHVQDPTTLFFKCGAATGIAFGRLVATPQQDEFCLQNRATPRQSLLFRQGMVFVQHVSLPPFAVEGDSGAPVYNGNGDLLGLIVAVDSEGVAVMPIITVLNLFGLAVPCHCGCE
ncbi:hypothetical protein RCL1_007991 [Eukaryota sp. TZLM3-RCL]